LGGRRPKSAKANYSLSTSANLDLVQSKLFRSARQDDHGVHCAAFVIQILGDAHVVFRVFGAQLRTVLSATTVLEGRPPASAGYRAAI
jgi:hypothetical protein